MRNDRPDVEKILRHPLANMACGIWKEIGAFRTALRAALSAPPEKLQAVIETAPPAVVTKETARSVTALIVAYVYTQKDLDELEAAVKTAVGALGLGTCFPVVEKYIDTLKPEKKGK